MKAAIHKKYGPPEVVKVMAVEKPVPKDNEVLIIVFATFIISFYTKQFQLP